MWQQFPRSWIGWPRIQSSLQSSLSESTEMDSSKVCKAFYRRLHGRLKHEEPSPSKPKCQILWIAFADWSFSTDIRTPLAKGFMPPLLSQKDTFAPDTSRQGQQRPDRDKNNCKKSTPFKHKIQRFLHGLHGINPILQEIDTVKCRYSILLIRKSLIRKSLTTSYMQLFLKPDSEIRCILDQTLSSSSECDLYERHFRNSKSARSKASDLFEAMRAVFFVHHLDMAHGLEIVILRPNQWPNNADQCPKHQRNHIACNW